MSRSERNPKWLDRFQYPFCLNVFHSSSGAIHYVDEGKGKPIVFVHGSPEWSFAYRAQIKAFSSTHRCIAIDHLGFGLSDKPRRWSYLPEDQAKNFSNLMDYLDLKDVTLVVNDWGGPIGLSYAVANSSRIKQIILINTWFWSIGGDSYRKFFNQLAGSRLARVLIVKSGYLTKLFLSKAYLIDEDAFTSSRVNLFEPLTSEIARTAQWVFHREITKSSSWLNKLWIQLPSISSKPTLIIWGLKDKFLKPALLDFWTSLFPHAEVHVFKELGHFPHCENPREVNAIISEFLSSD